MDKSNKKQLISTLKNHEYASCYLQDALGRSVEINEFSLFLTAIRSVVEANGGMAVIAKKMQVGKESFYKSLQPDKKPRFATIAKALKSCGIEIKFKPTKGNHDSV